MARVYRKKNTPRWQVDITDALGVRRRLAGFESKPLTQKLADRLEQCRDALKMRTPPPSEALAWMEAQPPAVLGRFAELHLVDPDLIAANLPLRAHLADWLADIRRRQKSPKHARLYESRIAAVLERGRFVYWADVTPERLHAALADVADENGLSAQTHAHYGTAFKAFVRWCGDNGRLRGNPIRRLERRNIQADRRRTRRSLTDDEFPRLFAAAMASGETYCGMDGRDRAMLYLTAATTGLRWKELKGLTRGDFALGSEPPSIFLPAKIAKNRRAATVLLRPDVAVALADCFAARALSPTAPAFPISKSAVGAELIRRDLEAAGIPYADDRGDCLDFHALRHSFASGLVRAGVDIKTAQDLLRHSTPALTIGVYAHSDVSRRADALRALPIGIAPPDAPKALTEPANASKGNSDGKSGHSVDSVSIVSMGFSDTMETIEHIDNNNITTTNSIVSIVSGDFSNLDITDQENQTACFNRSIGLGTNISAGAIQGAKNSGQYRTKADDSGKGEKEGKEKKRPRKALRHRRFRGNDTGGEAEIRTLGGLPHSDFQDHSEYQYNILTNKEDTGSTGPPGATMGANFLKLTSKDRAALAKLITAWPTLPPTIRRIILALLDQS